MSTIDFFRSKSHGNHMTMFYYTRFSVLMSKYFLIFSILFADHGREKMYTKKSPDSSSLNDDKSTSRRDIFYEAVFKGHTESLTGKNIRQYQIKIPSRRRLSLRFHRPVIKQHIKTS